MVSFMLSKLYKRESKNRCSMVCVMQASHKVRLAYIKDIPATNSFIVVLWVQSIAPPYVALTKDSFNLLRKRL